MPSKSRLRQTDTPAARVFRAGPRLQIIDTMVPKPKQAEFFKICHDPRFREILFHGAIRAGKSQACAKMLVYWAMKFPGTYGVFRATEKELEDSTKKIMLRGDSVMPPSIPPRLVHMRNETYNKVTLVNGSEVLFRSLEPKERGKIRNVTFAGAFIDQVEELETEEEEDYYDELLGRLSHPGAPNKLLLAANPGPETHFICRRFGATEMTRRFRHPRTAHIHVSLLDNAESLDPIYVQDLLATKDTRPDYFERMVMGNWGAFGGKRFKNWSRAQHVVKRGDMPDFLDTAWDIYGGLDWGYAHPTVYLTLVVDFDARWWVVAEHYQAKLAVKDHAELIKRQRRNEDGWATAGILGSLEPSVSWLDPSAWNRQRQEVSTVADTFRDHGIYCARAQNERIGGWNKIDELLSEIMPDGYGRLRFAPWCENVIREIPNLRIKPGTEDVEKIDDDAADALRYIVNSRIIPPEEKRKTPAEEHTREAVASRIAARRRTRDTAEDVLTTV